MKITILGAGSVGGTLGGRWAELGHEVVFGLRPSSSRTVPRGTKKAPMLEAVRASEVVVLAVPWVAALDTVRDLEDSLGGRVLLDCTNPIAAGMTLDVGPSGESGAERIQALAPWAKVVKIFNTTGFGNMANPSYKGAAALMLYAGDDVLAKGTASELAKELGFDAVDAGPLANARHLEHLALLWIGLAMGGMGRDIAFCLVRR